MRVSTLSVRRDAELVAMSYNQRSRLTFAYGDQAWQPPCVFGFRICAPVDAGLLGRALTVVMRRHSALRTYFPPALPEGMAACMREETSHWPLRVIDATEAELTDDAALAMLGAPFDPGEPPLLRAILVRRDGRNCLLGLAADHLNFDGASISVLVRDLSSVWQAMAAGTPAAELSAPVVPYERFVRWQDDWVAREGADALAYWMPLWRAGGLFPELALPRRDDADAVEPAGMIWRRRVPLADVIRAGEELRLGYFSPFMLVAGAIFHVMGARFGASDHGLLFSFANRLMPDADRAVGYYTNRLLLRVVTAADASFADVASAVRESAIGAMRYGALPFGLVRDQMPAGDRARRPAAASLFLNMEQPPPALAVPGGTATMATAEGADHMAGFPGLSIYLQAGDAAAAAVLSCGYDRKLYAQTTVDAVMSEVTGAFAR
jgi:condensation domain-containing protein